MLVLDHTRPSRLRAATLASRHCRELHLVRVHDVRTVVQHVRMRHPRRLPGRLGASRAAIRRQHRQGVRMITGSSLRIRLCVRGFSRGGERVGVEDLSAVLEHVPVRLAAPGRRPLPLVLMRTAPSLTVAVRESRAVLSGVHMRVGGSAVVVVQKRLELVLVEATSRAGERAVRVNDPRTVLTSATSTLF